MKIGFILMILGSVLSIAFASTPDGDVPADETVCDDLDGKEYGLCVSYCEARDCDEVDRPGCDRVRQKFIDITGAESMPCDVVTVSCPCWDSEELSALEGYECDEEEGFLVVFTDSNEYVYDTSDEGCEGPLKEESNLSEDEADACYLGILEKCVS